MDTFNTLSNLSWLNLYAFTLTFSMQKFYYSIFTLWYIYYLNKSFEYFVPHCLRFCEDNPVISHQSVSQAHRYLKPHFKTPTHFQCMYAAFCTFSVLTMTRKEERVGASFHCCLIYTSGRNEQINKPNELQSILCFWISRQSKVPIYSPQWLTVSVGDKWT